MKTDEYIRRPVQPKGGLQTHAFCDSPEPDHGRKVGSGLIIPGKAYYMHAALRHPPGFPRPGGPSDTWRAVQLRRTATLDRLSRPNRNQTTIQDQSPASVCPERVQLGRSADCLGHQNRATDLTAPRWPELTKCVELHTASLGELQGVSLLQSQVLSSSE